MYSPSKIIRPIGLIALTLGCFGLSPTAQAVCQEGCLTDFNTVLGDDALLNNSGSANTAIGSGALLSNTTGFDNTAIGSGALVVNTTGLENTASGVNALHTNTTGFDNTANGAAALQSNTAGSDNTATGFAALFSNTTGVLNTAIGSSALTSNTTGENNTAAGYNALLSNTTGNGNTATGLRALFSNTTGFENTANGDVALASNTTGAFNAATGSVALFSNTTGNSNTAIGDSALFLNTTGNSNIALGVGAGANLTTGDNNIDIGNSGRRGESNTIRIGKREIQKQTFIGGISGATVAEGVGVIIDANGQLGTIVSSERFKDAVRPMDKASEAILSLKPVTFRYKTALDPKGIPQFGLVAEQVEKVDPDLVARDGEGKPYTVRYEAVNAMLLNEFLKEHRKVEQQDRKIEGLEATVAQLQAALKVQAAQIQKVSDQLRTQPLAPRVVADN